MSYYDADPFFYTEEGEGEPVRCYQCSDELDQDDIIWADIDGQLKEKEGNDTAWCVACLPNEKEGESE